MVVDRLILATCLAFGLTVAGSALAQDPANPATSSEPAGKPDFAKLDKHSRGYLLRSDIPHAMAYLRLHFSEADYNHDGRLSAAEYAASNQDFPDGNLVGTQQHAQEGAVNRRESERLNLHSNSSGH